MGRRVKGRGGSNSTTEFDWDRMKGLVESSKSSFEMMQSGYLAFRASWKLRSLVDRDVQSWPN